eukprot:scpid79997/ scgid30659/ 
MLTYIFILYLFTAHASVLFFFQFLRNPLEPFNILLHLLSKRVFTSKYRDSNNSSSSGVHFMVLAEESQSIRNNNTKQHPNNNSIGTQHFDESLHHTGSAKEDLQKRRFRSQFLPLRNSNFPPKQNLCLHCCLRNSGGVSSALAVPPKRCV